MVVRVGHVETSVRIDLQGGWRVEMSQIGPVRSVRLSSDGRSIRRSDEPFLHSMVRRIDDEQSVARRIEENTLRKIQKITSNTTETSLTSDCRSTGIPPE